MNLDESEQVKSEEVQDTASSAELPAQSLHPADPITCKIKSETTVTSHDEQDLNLERPKIALQDSRRFGFRQTCLHLLATSMSVIVLQLSARGVYWTDQGATRNFETILNTLQLAAKAHEIIVLMSISKMAIHICRYQLMGDGVTFGLLTIPYQLQNLENLVSRSFWYSLYQQCGTRSMKNRSGRWLFPSILLVAFILSPTIGPSSAVLIIPRLDWWPFKQAIPDVKVSIWMASSMDGMYPLSMTPDLWRGTDCRLNGTQNGVCPSGSFSDVKAWARFSNDSLCEPNITISNLGASRLLVSKDDGDYLSGWSAATILTDWVGTDLGLLWAFLGRTDNPVSLRKSKFPMFIPSMPDGHRFLKPLVEVQCEIFYDHNNQSKLYLPHNLLKTPPMDRYQDEVWSIPNEVIQELFEQIAYDPRSEGQIWADWYSGERYTYPAHAFIDLSSHERQPSLGMVLAEMNSSQIDGVWKYTPNVIGCTLDARWIPVDITFTPTVTPYVQDTLADPADYVLSGQLHDAVNANVSAVAFQPIMIDLEWAKALSSTESNDSSVPVLDQTIGGGIKMLPKGAGENETVWPQWYTPGKTTLWTASTTVGLNLAAALARHLHNMQPTLVIEDLSDESNATLYRLDEISYQSWNGNLSYLKEVMATSMHWLALDTDHPVYTPDWTRIDFEVRRYGYGYGLRGASTILAAIVVLLHCVLAVVYISTIIWLKWCSTAWENTTDLIALAINSPAAPTSLQNTCVAVEQVTTSKRTVMVREVRREHLGLVFPTDGDGNDLKPLVQPRKRYG